MISRNTDGFRIKVVNEQTIGDTHDTVTEEAAGTLRHAGGKWYISYRLPGCVCLIKTDGDTVFIKRTGEYGSEMEFEPGSGRTFMYRTPYGTIGLELFTESVAYELAETGGFIRLGYTLSQNGDKIYNNMIITIER